MRVFVTGATGFVGSAVVQELIHSGHQVLGLSRSEPGAKSSSSRLRRSGTSRGSRRLGKPAQPRSTAMSDGVIHCAFKHDFSKFVENCETDRRAIETLGAALAGTDRALLVSGGIALLAPGRLATENDAHPPISASFPRVSETTAAKLAEQGVCASVVRLPQVHDTIKQGFVSYAIAVALRRKGCLGVYRRRAQPLAGSARARYRPSLQAGAGERCCGSPVSRNRGRGRAAPRDRGSNRPGPEGTGCQQETGGGGRPFWLPRALRGDRLPGLQRSDTATAGMAPNWSLCSLTISRHAYALVRSVKRMRTCSDPGLAPETWGKNSNPTAFSKDGSRGPPSSRMHPVQKRRGVSVLESSGRETGGQGKGTSSPGPD